MNVASRQRPVDRSLTGEETAGNIPEDGALYTQPVEPTITRPTEHTVIGPMRSIDTLHEEVIDMGARASIEDVTQADDQVCTFESGELWAEEISHGWAVIPEVDLSPEGIELKDI